ncbi:MAG: hypothetical protein KDA24_16830 [Deltaproteobacteria bacterium]|nr:hypothetical protein [Deltaproteobacteria bacterium]
MRLRPALLCAALFVLAPGAAGADEPPSPRDVIADGLYLESGMGDLAGAAARYESLLARDDVPTHLRAEALLRLGLARERLADVAAAEAAYAQLLEELPSSRWSEDARSRLQSIEEDRKRVRSLPVEFTFTDGTDGLFHARTRAHKGSLNHEVLEDEDGRHEVASWRTYVVAREDDLAQVGFEKGLMVQGRLSLTIRAVGFPAHLIFFLVDADGRRFATTTHVVRPEEGWRALTFSPGDFRDRSSGSEDGYRSEALTNLWIQDVTGYSSTDRGENILWIDSLTLE